MLKNEKDKIMFLDYMNNLAILFDYTSNNDDDENEEILEMNLD